MSWMILKRKRKRSVVEKNRCTRTNRHCWKINKTEKLALVYFLLVCVYLLVCPHRHPCYSELKWFARWKHIVIGKWFGGCCTRMLPHTAATAHTHTQKTKILCTMGCRHTRTPFDGRSAGQPASRVEQHTTFEKQHGPVVFGFWYGIRARSYGYLSEAKITSTVIT